MNERSQQRIRFTGGPLDGAEIRLDADFRPPEEIIFREPSEVEPIEHVYRLTVNFSITPESLDTTTYRHRGHSEVFRLIHCQSRRIVLLEDEVNRLQKQAAGRNSPRRKGPTHE